MPVWLEVHTKDESLVQAVEACRHSGDLLRHLPCPSTAAPAAEDKHPLLAIIDARLRSAANLGAMIAAMPHADLILVITASRHPMDQMRQLMRAGHKVDFLSWPAPLFVLKARLDLIRGLLTRKLPPTKQTRFAPKNGEALFLATIEWLPVMISVLDLCARPFLMNAAMRDFLHPLVAGEDESRELWHWVHPQERADLVRHLAEAMTTQQPKQFTTRMQNVDGAWRSVAVTAAGFFAKDGAHAGFVVALEDVTGFVSSEDKLRDSEAMYRELAESLPVKIAEISQDGRILFRNALFRAYFPSDLNIGQLANWARVVHPADFQMAHDIWESSWRKGLKHDLELRVLDEKTQTYRWHRIIMTPDRHVAPWTWIASATDIDDQKRREKELQELFCELSEQSRTKREFLAALSHELRTPLNVILGYCTLLQESSELEPAEHKALTEIARSAGKILTLIQALPWPDDTPPASSERIKAAYVD